MTRKDYILIAAALRDCKPREKVGDFTDEMVGACFRDVCDYLANALARDNPRFDRERFLKAAGVQS